MHRLHTEACFCEWIAQGGLSLCTGCTRGVCVRDSALRCNRVGDYCWFIFLAMDMFDVV